MEDNRDRRLYLLQRLPDIPRWVELRSLLRRPETVLLGVREEPLAAVVASRRFCLAAVVGRPAGAALHEAVALVGEELEVLAPPEDAAFVDSLLPGWKRQDGVLHTLPPWHALPESEHDVRFAPAEEVSRLPDLPERLQSEVLLAWGPVAVTWLKGRPVSFCYAASETETLWADSNDTRPGYRRRGAAAAAAAALIRRMRRRGKEPVWGAFVSNPASLGLAARLGFRPADRITAWTRPASRT